MQIETFLKALTFFDMDDVFDIISETTVGSPEIF